MSRSAITLLAVGATGSIGGLVVAEAVHEGYAVRALVRDASQAKQFPPAIEVAVGDLTQVDTLGEALSGVE